MKNLAMSIGLLLVAGAAAAADGKSVFFVADRCVPVKDKSVDSAYVRLTSEFGKRLRTVVPPTTAPGGGRYFIAVGTASDGEELVFPITDDRARR